MVTGASRKEARALSFRNALACQLGWKLASVRIISVGSCRLWVTAIKHLDDRELERLILAALQERDRRKLPVPEKSERKSQTEMATVALPQGKLNAIRAAFKAGVPPSRIAKQFGVSRSDVQTSLVGYAKTR
jgi:hypothetical protein